MGYKSGKVVTARKFNANRMKRVYEAFDSKDLSSLTSMLIHGYLDPNRLIPDKGVTFFHLIIGHQSETFAFKVAKLFLRYGGDPNVGSEDSVTPVHVAAAWGRSRILHLLLVNGGDPWLHDDDKKNAFNYAFEEQEWDAVEMLHHFQQMHSSSSRKDTEKSPKFELNLERVLLRKGEDMYEYSMSNDKDVKSAKTQTQDENGEKARSKCDSPVLDIIKYFESHPSNGEMGWRKPEKIDVGWSKEYYETSCKLLVNSDDNKSENSKNEKEEGRFVSSIHVDTTNLKTEEISSGESVIALSKSSNESLRKSEVDIRSQLFTELREAVLRRSKRRVEKCHENEKEEEVNVNSREPSVVEVSKSEPSIICISNESKENSVIEDSFARKETPVIQGLNLESNSLLKHMSDFATKVMQEIEMSEAENGVGRVSESASSDQLMASTFLTCEDDSFARDDDSNANETRSTSGNGLHHRSSMEKSNDSFLSITEEYKYTDNEDGIVLVEKKHVVNPPISCWLK
ncbi:UNVERIFIED_CONTAM: hypothetical protein PYX00_000130 [Menopon gallinae]|uniref:Uncharacterized protein n=1 Tax=Menopon gallinae TaxID=328185 RepID=A0AAW2I949_9NEOP